MRFAILLKATATSEAGIMPSKDSLAAMTAYNEELVNGGYLEAGEGLQPSSRGARVVFSGDDGSSSRAGTEERTGSSTTVVHGPFDQDAPDRLVAGFWLLKNLCSLDEAVGLVRRCPSMGEEMTVEVRPVHECEDFDDGSVEAGRLREREEELRQKVASG
ncbi:hypothetical protein MMC16_004297 [Acarospora aff. strigata]|nr:hypothetical protein [Acarospora aff. strigata]